MLEQARFICYYYNLDREIGNAIAYSISAHLHNLKSNLIVKYTIGLSEVFQPNLVRQIKEARAEHLRCTFRLEQYWNIR